jgi:hypothetical protein
MYGSKYFSGELDIVVRRERLQIPGASNRGSARL